jgi:hypothetical protein
VPLFGDGNEGAQGMPVECIHIDIDMS